MRKPEYEELEPQVERVVDGDCCGVEPRGVYGITIWIESSTCHFRVQSIAEPVRCARGDESVWVR